MKRSLQKSISTEADHGAFFMTKLTLNIGNTLLKDLL